MALVGGGVMTRRAHRDEGDALAAPLELRQRHEPRARRRHAVVHESARA